MTYFGTAIATFELSAAADGMSDRTLRWYLWLLRNGLTAIVYGVEA